MKNGFTIINLIISIAVFAVLSAIVLISVNPAERIQDAKDTRRQQDVIMIAKALKDYSLDHQGQLPFTTAITTNKKVLCANATSLTCGVDIQDCLAIDMTTDFLDAYLPTLPFDPNKTSSADSGYYLQGTSTGFLDIGACSYDSVVVVQKTNIKY